MCWKQSGLYSSVSLITLTFTFPGVNCQSSTNTSTPTSSSTTKHIYQNATNQAGRTAELVTMRTKRLFSAQREQLKAPVEGH